LSNAAVNDKNLIKAELGHQHFPFSIVDFPFAISFRALVSIISPGTKWQMENLQWKMENKNTEAAGT
jgi:hypothetical protein